MGDFEPWVALQCLPGQPDWRQDAAFPAVALGAFEDTRTSREPLAFLVRGSTALLTRNFDGRHGTVPVQREGQASGNGHPETWSNAGAPREVNELSLSAASGAIKEPRASRVDQML